MRRSIPAIILLLASQAPAQFGRGGGDWMTIGNDAQRSHWVRGDAKISPQTMQKPGFEMVWKVKMNMQARQMNSLTPPALIDFYIGYRGFRTLGFFGASSDKVIAIDTDLARLEWEKGFGAPTSSGTAQCPGGMTSSVARPTFTAYPGAFTARGFGRGGAAKSGVGEPFEGAVTLKPAAPPPPPPPAPSARPGRAAAPAPNPFARAPQYVHAVTADGKFHSMYLSNGDEPNPPVDFLPPNANAIGLILYGGHAYVATVNGCGGADNGVWALELQSKKVTQWKSTSGNIAGTEGFAAGPDGTLYVAAGNELVALEAGTLKPKSSFKAGSRSFTSSPVVFEYKDKDLIAAATSDGRLVVLDAGSLGNATPLAQSEVHSKPGFAAGALASWQDSSGARWILAPAAPEGKTGAIVAWKVVEKGSGIALETGWVSRDMAHPLTPAIVNGVIFALDGGSSSGNAVLYALDSSGKELWNSGKTITSFVRTGGLSAGGGRVYVGAHDGTQFAFGFPMEH